MHPVSAHPSRAFGAAKHMQRIDMNTNGLLALGVSEIVARDTGKLIGYAFVEANSKGFFERWLLYTNPRNEFDVRAAPAAMAGWSLADWQEKVPELWQPNSYYVWAQAKVYQHGQTYDGVTWSEIPAGANLPLPLYPGRGGAPFQLDWDGCFFPSLWQGQLCGYGFVLNGLNQSESAEYWLLPAGYAPTNASMSVAPNPQHQAASVDAFVQFANQQWGTGATFCITGCTNYKETEPPLKP